MSRPLRRYPKDDAGELVSLTKQHITRQHVKQMLVWKRALDIAHMDITLFAFDYRKEPKGRQRLARLILRGRDGPHGLGLSTRTLASDDWKDSLLHELLHALIWDCRNRRQTLTLDGEERLVLTLTARLLPAFAISE